jgi:hypothetical protein
VLYAAGDGERDLVSGPGGGESAVAAILRIRGPTMPLAVLCAQRGTAWVAALAAGRKRPSTAISGPGGISLAASSLGVALRLPSRSGGVRCRTRGRSGVVGGPVVD